MEHPKHTFKLIEKKIILFYTKRISYQGLCTNHIETNEGSDEPTNQLCLVASRHLHTQNVIVDNRSHLKLNGPAHMILLIITLVSRDGSDESIRTVLHPSLLTYIKYESRWRPRPNTGPLTPLASYTYMFKLGDNCVQNFHLGRYIVGYTVGNLVLRRRSSGAVKRDFRTNIRQYTSPNENFEYGYPHSNALLQFLLKFKRCKLHKAAHHPT